MHSDTIWKYWKLQKSFEINVLKACILMFFVTIWNCREIDESNVYKACIVTGFKTIWNCRKNESEDVKLCIVTVFKTMWNCRESNANMDGKWCILTIFEFEPLWTFMSIRVSAHPSPPFAFIFYCIFWVLYCFDFLEKVVGPGIQGLHVIGSSRPLSVLMYTNNSATMLSVSLNNLYSDNGYGTMVVFLKSLSAVRKCFMFCNLWAVYLSWIL